MPRLETDKRQQPPERKLAAMNNYYIRWKGQVTGPLSLDQAREQFKSGKISRYHEMSIDQTSWKRPDGFPELTPPPPPPPMPVMPVAPPPPPVEEEEEAEIECRCPHCKKKVFVGESLVGKRAKCPKCGVKFMVQDELDAEADEHSLVSQMHGQSQFPSNMRTMFCRSCAAEISENAAMCPRCGVACTGNCSETMPDAQNNATKPSQVSLAVKLLYACLGIGLISSGRLIFRGSVATNEAAGVVVTILIMGVIFFVFLTVCIDKGKNWARIALLVLFLLGLPFSLPSLLSGFNQSLTIETISPLVQDILLIVALALLFQRTSAGWFKQKAVQHSTQRSMQSTKQVGTAPGLLLIVGGIVVICVVVYGISSFRFTLSSVDDEPSVEENVPAAAAEENLRTMAKNYRYLLGRNGSGTLFDEEDCYYLIKAAILVMKDEKIVQDFLNDVATNEAVYDKKISLGFSNGDISEPVMWITIYEGISTDFLSRCASVYNKIKELKSNAKTTP